MVTKLEPGSLLAHYLAQKIARATIQKSDDAFMDALLAKAPPKARLFLEHDPDLLPVLLADGECLRRYKQTSTNPSFPQVANVLRDLELLQTAWAGLISITVEEQATEIRVRFAII